MGWGLSALGLLSAAPAQAASPQMVPASTWGTSGLPSYVNMYLYVPDKLANKPPILVASHHCQGTGMGTYNETKSTWVSLADKNGFIIIFPEATGHNCWDVGSAKSLKHDGGGDTHAIAQMVRYTLDKYGGDASRVYAFGGSSGAMMTQALLGIYPDMFMGGVAVSGVPCGCWAASYTGDSGSTQQWSGPCAGGQVSKSAQEWGDQVRAMFPGYTGHRPRVQLWHGKADTTINYNNQTEAIKEWTNVLGLASTPTSTDSSTAGQTRQLWKNTCGFGVLETFALDGVGHAVNWDFNTAAKFLSLDQVGAADPETAMCSGTGTGGGGAGGSGSGGASSGGRSSMGGTSNAGSGSAGEASRGGASNASGGSGGSAGGGDSSSGGVASTAGATSVSGGASNPSGGTQNTGGTNALGGSAAGGLANVSGGNPSSAGNGGAATQGGVLGAGGSSNSTGGTRTTIAGATNTAGAPQTGGDSSGCSCRVAPAKSSGPASILLLATAVLGLQRSRRKRTRGRE